MGNIAAAVDIDGTGDVPEENIVVVGGNIDVAYAAVVAPQKLRRQQQLLVGTCSCRIAGGETDGCSM